VCCDYLLVLKLSYTESIENLCLEGCVIVRHLKLVVRTECCCCIVQRHVRTSVHVEDFASCLWVNHFSVVSVGCVFVFSKDSYDVEKSKTYAHSHSQNKVAKSL